MARYVFKERGYAECNCFTVDDTKNGVTASLFYVSDYGLDEARRRAEAEAKWLNERAEKWTVREVNIGDPDWRHFCVITKNRQDPRHDIPLYVSSFNGDANAARAEAERLCKILNERDASK